MIQQYSRCLQVIIVFALFFCATFVTVSCTGIKQAPLEIHYYTIEYDPPVSITSTPLPCIIKIDHFSTSPLYDSNRMVFKTHEFTRDEYVYHKWRALPGEMVSFFLARDILETGRFQAVLYADSVSPYSQLVTGTIEAFYQYANGDVWEAVFEMTITLIDNSPPKNGNPVLFQKKYSTRKPISDKEPVGMARAMSEAMKQISGEIIADVYALLSK